MKNNLGIPKKTKKEIPVVIPTEKYIEEKLITARISLLFRQPFFGSMVTRLELIRDDSIDTAATDGRNFIYNLEFIAGLTSKELEFLFGHEVLHNVFEHHIRKNFPDEVNVFNKDGKMTNTCRHHLAWNIACDYAVNEILIESKIGEKIKGTLYDEKYRGKCAEEIYDMLMSNAENIDFEELSKMLLDKHLSDLEREGKTLSEGDKQKIREEIRENLLSSVQVAAGNIPMGVQRLVNNLVEPKLSWKELLRMDMQSTINYDYTFYKPNKKGMQNGVILPGMKKDEALDICIAIDTSASINEEILRIFLSEIQGIMSQYTDYQIRVWSFDVTVHNEQIFRSDEGMDICDYIPEGGGGTLFESNFDYMQENSITPKVLVFFTDMYPNAGWGDPNYCDHVIFVGYKSNNIIAPYGTTITID